MITSINKLLHIQAGKYDIIGSQESIAKTISDMSGIVEQVGDAFAVETKDPFVIIKEIRDALLAESDWTQLVDIEYNIREAYRVYRQALRDLTKAKSVFDIVWPITPNHRENKK